MATIPYNNGGKLIFWQFHYHKTSSIKAASSKTPETKWQFKESYVF
jgi:hypothetical protein